tara:strand:+ start:82211 stop:85303 length:3093 start_codon:yes stop_codon:yes gene_type:complete
MIGLTLASVMLVVFSLIIWWSMGSMQKQQPGSGDAFPTDPGEIPDITELEQGARMFVTIVDRDDPTRIAGTLEADQFQPIGGGQRRLLNPDAWINMRDGRRVHITADRGVVMMPDPNEAPDSGTLEGDVTIQSYAATDVSVDPLSEAMGMNADQLPTLTAKFDEPVEFERRYQRLTSQGRFTVESPEIEFIGHTLTVMLNEVQGRIELLDVRKGERLVLRPNAKKDTKTTFAPPRSSAYTITTVAYPSIAINAPMQETTDSDADDSDAEQAAVVKEPKKTPYHIEFQDSVLVNMVGSGTLSSENLDIWAMLIDGALSPDAIKQFKFAKVDESTKPAQPVPVQQSQTQSAQPKATAPAPATTPKPNPVPVNPAPAQTAVKDGEVVITWDGPLVMRPVEDPMSTALATEEVAIAFTSSSRVAFDASIQGVHGSADSIRYGATTGTVEFVGTRDSRISIIADDTGLLESESLHAQLGTGIITIDSPGMLESVPSPTEPPARIHWGTGAEFALVQTEDGELSSRLRSARFEGAVLGTRADAVLQTETLLATLDEDGPMESSLRSITLTNGSMRSDSGSLTSDAMTIGFVPINQGTGVTPSTLNADGSVLGISVDGRVETDQLDAILVREMDGQTRVRSATAIGSTEFLGENQTQASGQRVELNTDNDMIHIIGSRGDKGSAGQGGSIIQGEDIWINTRSRSIQVNGPGTFDHDIVTDGVATGGHLNVKWTESMRFDDAIGSIECAGDVVALSTPDAYTTDTLKADRLEIDLTPTGETDQVHSPDAVVQDDQVTRELLSARAYGRAVPGSESIPASVESRTYDPQQPERAIGVMYLEGPSIIADNQRQILRVPAPGMMVLMDRSNEDGADTPADDSSSVMPSTSGPGLTRMTWLGSMELDRIGGHALVLNEVNIRHKSLATGRISQLGCDRIDATFSTPDNDMVNAGQVGAIALQRADASGRVRFSDLERTLLSDYAVYDAAAGTLFAYADGNRLVTLRDSMEPTPVSARTLLWDLNKDLVEIDAPSPVRLPARP